MEKWIGGLKDLTHIWIWEMDINGIHTYSNDAVEGILGYSAKEIVGKDSIDLWPERTRTQRQLERHHKSLRSGKGWKGFQALFQHKDGHSVYTLSSGAPIFDEDGILTGYRGMDHEITERVERERQLRLSRERTLELVDILDLINNILIHDLRNDLFTLKTGLDLFFQKNDTTLLESSRKVMDRSLGTISRMKELKTFMGNDEPLHAVNVNRVIEEVMGGFDIGWKINGDLTIDADDAVYSVFENLVRNSIIHGISTEMEFDLHRSMEGGIIKIRDNGSGIPDKIRSSIFDEFVSAGNTKGSGLGLYIVRKAVERYGGSITLTNGKEKGAVFEIRLPCEVTSL